MFNLLQPDAERIFPSQHAPTHDHASEDLVAGSPAWLRNDMVEIVGEQQVHSRLIDLVKYATDASPYRLFPKIVVSPRTIDEIARIFAYGHEKKIPITIRAAGSSLSGQSQGDGILIDVRRNWVGSRTAENACACCLAR